MNGDRVNQARMGPAIAPRLLEGATTTETTLRDLVSPLFRHRRLATVCFRRRPRVLHRWGGAVVPQVRIQNGDSGKS